MLITLDFKVKTLNDPPWVRRVPAFITGTYKQNKLSIPFNASYVIEEYILLFKPDIIHLHHPFLLGPIGKSLAYKYTIPCVFTYHTMYEQYAHYIPAPQSIIKPLIQKIVLSFCKDVNALITPSCAIKRYLEKNGIVTPLSVIPSPVQNHFFEPLDNSINKKNDFFDLLYVGRFRKEKNVDYLIELFAYLDRFSYRLTFVGYGDQESILKRRAYDFYGFSPDDIRFVIKPTLNRLRQLYTHADLFLFPSQTDTQGLVLAEAMAHSTPVLALPGPGQEDIIRDGINGFIVKDTVGMLHHIQMIKNNSVLHKHLSEGAYQTSIHFSQKTVISLLVDLYYSIL